MRSPYLVPILVVGLAATAAAEKAPVTAESARKIPITTTSDAARQDYLKGRDLFEKL